MNMKPQTRVLISAVVVLVVALFASLAFLISEVRKPAVYTTQCIAEETMVVKSSKSDHFDLTYGKDCK